MLPDLSAAHIFLLVVVALVVVGPKDLPSLLRKVGQFMARLRGMANEFRASFDEMARQSELDELRREVSAMRAAAAKPMEEFRAVAADLHSDVHQGLSDFSAPPPETSVEAAPAAVAPPQPESEQAPAPKPRKAKAVSKASPARGAPAKAGPAKAADKPGALAKKAKPRTPPKTAEPGA